MTAFFTVILAFLGLAVGGFLRLCGDRLPRGESIIINPPSHCDVCHHRLGVRDLIPVLSYLRLKGRCRYCNARLPKSLLWVELATGIIFAFLYWWCIVLNPELGVATFAVMAFYACVFILIFIVDLEHKLILNKVVFPSMVVALLLALFPPQPWLTQWIFTGVANAAIGGVIGFVIFFLLAVISRGGMGWGDVKLAALIGLATGFPLVFISLFIAAISGGVAALILLLAKKKGRKEGIPFGIFLAPAAMITLLWGSSILNWYIGLM